MDDAELAEIKQVARNNRMTVAEWVRQALRAARQSEPVVTAEGKLRVVREAACHSYPSGDIDRMLAQIERGYLAEPSG